MLTEESTREQHAAEAPDSADLFTRVGQAARYALAGIRVVNGAVALITPGVIIGRFGESEISPARMVLYNGNPPTGMNSSWILPSRGKLKRIGLHRMGSHRKGIPSPN